MGAHRVCSVLIGLAISLGSSGCAHLGAGRSGQAGSPAQPTQPASGAQPPSPAQPATSAQPPSPQPTVGAQASEAAPPRAGKPQSQPPAAVNRKPTTSDPSDSSPKPPSAPQAGQSAAPTLDLNSLEQRLRDTHAIGVFTKLSLKNQVDDLLAAFRAFHGKQPGKTLTQLRQQYDVLLLKVLSLLQDSDPSLAAAIASSREAIWGILTDPQKFSKI